MKELQSELTSLEPNLKNFDDTQLKIFWTFFIPFVISGILWVISFYFCIPLIKYTTFLIAVSFGFKAKLKISPKLRDMTKILFIISYISTIFITSFRI
ncbi:hypothetical protein [Candidatus Phytoplasma fraxini]